MGQMMNEFSEWGKWARHNHDRLGYPCQWFEMIMRDNVPTPPLSYTITDERAMAIDKAVCALARHSVVLYRIFCLRYLARWSLRTIAREYLTLLEYPEGNKEVPVYHTKALLNRAEGFIIGVLTC